jgi:hypothetical protein
MDPNAALKTWVEADFDSTERLEAYEALSGWIARGGFPPTGDDLAWTSFMEVMLEEDGIAV